jgi:hypothetical protein
VDNAGIIVRIFWQWVRRARAALLRDGDATHAHPGDAVAKLVEHVGEFRDNLRRGLSFTVKARKTSVVNSPSATLHEIATPFFRTDAPRISRKASGLSRPNLYLDLTHCRRMAGDRRLEVQFKCLAEISERFLFCAALAGNIQVQALGDKPISFAPDRRGKRAFHKTILPHFFGMPSAER